MTFKEFLIPAATRFGFLFQETQNGVFVANVDSLTVQAGFHNGVLHLVLWNPLQIKVPSYMIRVVKEHVGLHVTALNYMNKTEYDFYADSFRLVLDWCLQRIKDEIQFEMILPF